jgi:hypothetical protein
MLGLTVADGIGFRHGGLGNWALTDFAIGMVDDWVKRGKQSASAGVGVATVYTVSTRKNVITLALT